MTTRSELFFEFGDKRGEANFIAWHQSRHHTYDLLASQHGNSLPPLDLTGKIDGDWLQRHSTRHKTHRRLAGIFSGSNNVGLTVLHWRNPVERGVWLYRHAVEHSIIDQFYGLT